MKEFHWKTTNYKQMQGKWKISILLEAGYKECNTLENISKLLKLTDRIYFQNALLPYPKSQQLLPEELETWCQGIRLVSEQIEARQTESYLIIALRNIQFSDCNIQEEAFTASSMQWASEIFGFSTPEVRVFFEQNANFPYGRYIYDFTAKIVFDVWQEIEDPACYKEQYKLQTNNAEMLISGRICEDIKCGDRLFTAEGNPITIKKILAYGHNFDALQAGMTCILLIDRIEHNFQQFEKLYNK